MRLNVVPGMEAIVGDILPSIYVVTQAGKGKVNGWSGGKGYMFITVSRQM